VDDLVCKLDSQALAAEPVLVSVLDRLIGSKVAISTASEGSDIVIDDGSVHSRRATCSGRRSVTPGVTLNPHLRLRSSKSMPSTCTTKSTIRSWTVLWPCSSWMTTARLTPARVGHELLREA
jgi:hypothetical protein